jgi:hypothetical protein
VIDTRRSLRRLLWPLSPQLPTAAALLARPAAILETVNMDAAHTRTPSAALTTLTAAPADTFAMPPLRSAFVEASRSLLWYATFPKTYNPLFTVPRSLTPRAFVVQKRK